MSTLTADNPAPGSAPASALSAAPASVAQPAGGTCYRFDDVEFDELKGQLRVAGRPLAMEPKPLQVLSELLLRVNEVVTKDELFDAVWDGRDTVDHVLANAIRKLRSAMGKASGSRIVTVHRIGYRFEGPVQRVNTAAARRTFETGQAVPRRESFVLERSLGEGSRSEVWLAHHSQLGQAHVFKFASDGPGLAALKREYALHRALKEQLGPRHDIVVVLDSNFVYSPYFLEFEYGGQSLPDWEGAGAPLAGLSRSERLALFLQIANTVAAAHSVGILHKDLKPANVLVAQASLAATGPPDKAWRTQLADFGSGRVLDPDVFQRLNITALAMTQGPGQDTDRGTFGYMAPELASGGASTVQSDVYSLGVMLYQLLIADLERPLSSGWQREVDDPLLVQDILAATEGKPEQRLNSVAELILRLQSLTQRREQQVAQAATLRLQEERAAADHRRRVRQPWIVLAAVLATVGLGVSLWFAHEARLALAQALQQTEQAQTFEEFLTQDVLAADAVFYRENVSPQSMVNSLRLAATRLDQRFAANPLTELDLRLRVAKTLRLMGAIEDARKQAQAAYQLAQQLPSRPAERMQAALELALVQLPFYSNENTAGLLAEAMALGGQALLRADKREAIPLVEAQAAEQLGLGRFTESGRLARRWIELVDRHLPKDLAQRLQARAFLLEVTLTAQDLAAAQELALQMDAEVVALGGSTRAMIAQSQRQLAGRLAGRGEVAAATAMLKTAIGRATQDAPALDLQLAWHYANLGQVQATSGQLEAALESLSHATAGFQRSMGDDYQFYRQASIQLAIVQAMLGQYRPAAESLRQHRAWFARVQDASPRTRLSAWLAISLAGSRQPEAALAVLKEMSEPAKGSNLVPKTDAGTDAPEMMVARGWAWTQLGRAAEGSALMRQGLDSAAQEQPQPRYWARLEAAWAAETRGQKADRTGR